MPFIFAEGKVVTSVQPSSSEENMEGTYVFDDAFNSHRNALI